MIRLELEKFDCSLEFSDKDYENLQVKRIIDEETGEFLYNARVVSIDDNIILIAKESAFKVIEPKIKKENWKVQKQRCKNDNP